MIGACCGIAGAAVATARALGVSHRSPSTPSRDSLSHVPFFSRPLAPKPSAADHAAAAADDATPDSTLIAAAVDPLASLPRHLAVEAFRQLGARLYLPTAYADGSPIAPLDGAP